MPPVIRLEQGDITEYKVDAIVNAANPQLAGGGGVDGAIHRVAGPELLSACKEIQQHRGNCPPGQAVITPAFALPAKYVIHAVGPIWPKEEAAEGRRERKLLFETYQSSLALALEHKCHSVAFPNISTGVYGFPKEQAAHVSLTAIKDFCDQHPESRDILELVYIVCFDDENYRIYCEIFE